MMQMTIRVRPSSTLYFSYTGDGLTELFPAKMSNVWLYVFNTDDVLVTKLSIDRTQLSAYQGTKLTLPPRSISCGLLGKYI